MPPQCLSQDAARRLSRRVYATSVSILALNAVSHMMARRRVPTPLCWWASSTMIDISAVVGESGIFHQLAPPRPRKAAS